MMLNWPGMAAWEPVPTGTVEPESLGKTGITAAITMSPSGIAGSVVLPTGLSSVKLSLLLICCAFLLNLRSWAQNGPNVKTA